MSVTDQDTDKDYVNRGTQAAENYANKEGKRKMASNLNRPAKGKGASQTKSPGAPQNPNIQRGGFGVPKSQSRQIQRGGLGATGNALRSGMPGAKAIQGVNDLRNGNITAGAKGIAKEAIEEAVKKGAAALVASPVFWIVLLILLIILFLFWLLLSPDSSSSNNPCSTTGAPADTLTIKVDGPQTAKVGDPLVYTFTIADTQQDQDITIVDHLPDGVSLTQADITSTWSKFTFDPAQKTITWKASENQGGAAAAAQPGGQQPPANNQPATNVQPAAATTINTANLTFTVTLKSTADNLNLVNYADANATRGTAAPAIASNSAGGGINTVSGDLWSQLLTMEDKYIKAAPNWGQFLDDARTVSQQEDYPIAVIIGQGALETGHGSSNIAKTKANYFGFKVYDANPGAGSSYADPMQSIKDYVNLIKTGNGGKNSTYLEAYASRNDPSKMVELIRAAGYATDPSYVSKVTGEPEFKLLAGIPSGTGIPGAPAGGAGGCPPASALSHQTFFAALRSSMHDLLGVALSRLQSVRFIA